MSDQDPLPPAERGLSTILGYVFSLAIAAMLVSGLFIAGGSFVDDRREQVIRQELRVIGHQVASNVEKADRLANASTGATTVQVNQTFPMRVTGSTYQIYVESGADPAVVLTSTHPGVVVDVPLRTTTSLRESSVDGGLVSVQYDESAGELVISDV